MNKHIAGEHLPLYHLRDAVLRFLHVLQRDADVKDLVFTRDERVIFDIPGTEIPLPIPYILCYREIQFSGVLVHSAAPVPSDEAKKRKAIKEMNQLLDRLNPEEDGK